MVKKWTAASSHGVNRKSMLSPKAWLTRRDGDLVTHSGGLAISRVRLRSHRHYGFGNELIELSPTVSHREYGAFVVRKGEPAKYIRLGSAV